MASVIDICNTGLAHIGARAQISSISPVDGSVEAGYCARFYPLARRELIEGFSWTFAKSRVTLAEVTNPSTVWAYAYALPADCIKPLRVLSLAVISAADLWGPLGVYGVIDGRRLDVLLTERGSEDFEVEDEVLLTHEPEAVLLYKRDVTDTSKFSPMFVSAAGMLMAAYLAGPIIKGMDGAKIGAQWRQAASSMASSAAASDANSSSERADHLPAHLAVR